MSERKSLFFTYICALIGGLFGLHHLYLGRTQHALLWLTTFGGGGGIGLIYEYLFSMKTYVHEANRENAIINEYRFQMIRRKSPAFEISRLCGQYLTAVFYGFMTYYAFPDTWHQKTILSLLIAGCSTIAIAFGTQMTGTIGPRKCSFIWPLLGASLGMPFLVRWMDLSPSFNMPAFLSSMIFEWKIEWNPTYFSNSPATKSTSSRSSMPVKRCLIFGLGVIVFGAILTSTIYHNLHVDIKGRHVRIKDVLADLFKSHGIASLYRQVWAFYLQHGLKGIWMTLDSESNKQAYEALSLRSSASQSEIESQCRILPRKWHPDRYQNPEEKRKAEKTFLNIQQACDRLSNGRKRRQIINTPKRDHFH